MIFSKPTVQLMVSAWSLSVIGGGVGWLVGMPLLAVGLLGTVLALGHYRLDRFAVTHERVLHITGVFQRDVTTQMLDKVEDVVVKSTVLGRSLRYGTTWVQTGAGTLGPITYLRSPSAWRDQILNAMERRLIIRNPAESAERPVGDRNHSEEAG